MKDIQEQFAVLWGYLTRLQDALQVEPMTRHKGCLVLFSWLANVWGKNGVRNPRATPASQWASLPHIQALCEELTRLHVPVGTQAAGCCDKVWLVGAFQLSVVRANLSAMICMTLSSSSLSSQLCWWPHMRPTPGTKLAHWICCPLPCWLAAYHRTLAHSNMMFYCGCEPSLDVAFRCCILSWYRTVLWNNY